MSRIERQPLLHNVFAHKTDADRSVNACQHRKPDLDSYGCWSVRKHGQRPTPSSQLPSDGGVGHHGAFLPLVEADPSSVEPVVSRVSTGPSRRGRCVPAFPQPPSGTMGLAVMPGRLNQEPSDVTVTGLGQPTPDRLLPEAYSVGTKAT